MSGIKDRVLNDIKEAMKSGDNLKRDTLRMLNSAFKQIEVDERKVLSDAECIKIIQKLIKQREESSIQYKSANREDLYQKEIDEANILKAYLPQQLSDEELREKLKIIIETLGVTNIKEIGKVMGVATKEFAGVADGKRVNEIAKELLS